MVDSTISWPLRPVLTPTRIGVPTAPKEHRRALNDQRHENRGHGKADRDQQAMAAGVPETRRALDQRSEQPSDDDGLHAPVGEMLVKPLRIDRIRPLPQA